MIKGRKLFSMSKPIISVLVLIFSIFGRRLNYFFFTLFRRFPGYLGKAIRYIFLKNCLKEMGENVIIGSGVYIKWPHRIKIGNNVAINEMCYIEGFGGVIIGNNVAIAHGTTIMSSNHTYEDKTKPMSLNPIIGAPIIIHDDVWVGCGVRILAGVQIQERTIVAAGAVVNRSFNSNVIIGGVPAKILKSIQSQNEFIQVIFIK